jgi:Tfp pilus assembly protein PilN
MKQQINLYQVVEQKKKLAFMFQHLLVLFGSFVMVLLFITVVNVYKHSTIKKEHVALEKKQIAKSQKLQVVLKQLPKEQVKDQIIAEINKYQLEQKEKEKVLQLLINARAQKINGFSEFFESLAKGSSVTQGMWLTRFAFKEGGDSVSLEGRALKLNAVTRLIAGLSKEVVFQGKSFGLFKVSLDEKNRYIDFLLETGNDDKL